MSLSATSRLRAWLTALVLPLVFASFASAQCPPGPTTPPPFGGAQTVAGFSPQAGPVKTGLAGTLPVRAYFNDSLVDPVTGQLRAVYFAKVDSIKNLPQGLSVSVGSANASNAAGVSFQQCFSVNGTMPTALNPSQTLELYTRIIFQDSAGNLLQRQDTLDYKLFDAPQFRDLTVNVTYSVGAGFNTGDLIINYKNNGNVPVQGAQLQAFGQWPKSLVSLDTIQALNKGWSVGNDTAFFNFSSAIAPGASGTKRLEFDIKQPSPSLLNQLVAYVSFLPIANDSTPANNRDTLFAGGGPVQYPVAGKLYVDANGNGSFDQGERTFEQMVMLVDSQGNTVAQDFADQGNFKLLAKQGGYKLTTALPKYHTLAQPSGGLPLPVQLGASGGVQQDLRFQPQAGQQDLSLYLNPNVQFQNGFNATLDLVYRNIGTTPVSNAKLAFNWPAKKINLDTTYAQNQGWQLSGGDTITYSFSQPIAPGQQGTKTLQFKVPVDTSLLNDTLIAYGTLQPTSADLTPADNRDTLNNQVVGSWDPNDKRLMNGLADRPEAIDVGQQRHEYMIRFQNTGTAPARKVELRDTLAGRFMPGTMQMLGASHDYTMQMLTPASLAGTVLVWRFNNIMLPDSNTNEPASHGYVRFSIKRQPGIALGDSVPNRAGIYFDFNPVVMTNTVSGEVADKTTSRPAAVAGPGHLDVTLYPNPSRGSFRIGGDFSTQAPATVHIRDLRGRLLLQRRLTAPDRQLRPELSEGLYLVEVTQGSRRAVRKLMIR